MPWAIEFGQSKKWYCGLWTALEDAFTLGQHIDAIKVVVDSCRRLMYGTDNGATLPSQFLQQAYALGCCHFIQTACWFIQKEDIGIIDQLEGNRQTLAFAAAQFICRHIPTMIKIEIIQYIRNNLFLLMTMFQLQIV